MSKQIKYFLILCNETVIYLGLLWLKNTNYVFSSTNFLRGQIWLEFFDEENTSLSTWARCDLDSEEAAFTVRYSNSAGYSQNLSLMCTQTLRYH